MSFSHILKYGNGNNQYSKKNPKKAPLSQEEVSMQRDAERDARDDGPGTSKVTGPGGTSKVGDKFYATESGLKPVPKELQNTSVKDLKDMINSAAESGKLGKTWMAPPTKSRDVLLEHINDMLNETPTKLSTVTKKNDHHTKLANDLGLPRFR